MTTIPLVAALESQFPPPSATRSTLDWTGSSRLIRFGRCTARWLVSSSRPPQCCKVRAPDMRSERLELVNRSRSPGGIDFHRATNHCSLLFPPFDCLPLQVRTDPGLRPVGIFCCQSIRSCSPQADGVGQGPSGLNATPVTPAWLSWMFPERRREVITVG